MNDSQMKQQLVRVGFSLGAKRYAGQHPTDAAHEFATAMLPVIKGMEDRIVARVEKETR